MTPLERAYLCDPGPAPEAPHSEPQRDQRAAYVEVCRELAEADGVAYCTTHGRVPATVAGMCGRCIGNSRAGLR